MFPSLQAFCRFKKFLKRCRSLMLYALRLPEEPASPESTSAPSVFKILATGKVLLSPTGDTIKLCNIPSATSSDRFAMSWSRSEEHTSELQSRGHLLCRLLLEKRNTGRGINSS